MAGNRKAHNRQGIMLPNQHKGRSLGRHLPAGRAAPPIWTASVQTGIVVPLWLHFGLS